MPASPQDASPQRLRWLARVQGGSLRPMVRRIERAAGNPRLVTALAAEARLARMLVREGFDVGCEVPTPAGRACDLVARRDALLLHFHIKSIEDSSAAPRVRRIPRALRALERIGRRLDAEVEWRSRLGPSAMKALAVDLAAFLGRASIGDEHTHRSPAGPVRGRCRVRATHGGTTVRLHAGIAQDRARVIARLQRLMRKARAQFLAGGENIIVVTGPPHLEWLFAQALLGTPVERWDALPRRGERIAIGRADDGFWHAPRDPASRIAVWLSTGTRSAGSTAFIRGELPRATREACAVLFRQCSEVP